jgi:hypothetical protein
MAAGLVVVGKTGLGLDSAESEHPPEGAAAVCAVHCRLIESVRNVNAIDLVDIFDMVPIHFLGAFLDNIPTPS